MDETLKGTELFAELYDVQPQAIIWMRPIRAAGEDRIVDFEYAYANDEGLNYLKLTRQEFTGLRISTTPTVADELRQAVFDEVLDVYTRGLPSETSTYNSALHKHARVLRTRLRGGVLSVVQDVTREKEIISRLEEQTRQLQEQKSLLDSILQNSSNGISVSEVFRNDEGKVVDALTIMANDAAVRYIGLPKDVYLSKRATEIEPGVIGSPYYQACIKTLETGAPFLMQYYMEATERWLELTVSRLDHNHLIQIFTDVTAIKEAQLSLERAADTLRTVFDSAQTGMFTLASIVDDAGALVDFRFNLVNTAIASFVGSEPRALEGTPVSRWFPGYQASAMFDMYRHTFETGEGQRGEVHYVHDGQESYLDIQSSRIDGYVLVSLTDHTTLRKSQLQLEQTVRALERSNNSLEDFAHAASHDMKEPLRKILIFAERLHESLAERASERERDLFVRIKNSAARMQLLVDDLLEFSHMSNQAGMMEEVDLNEKLKKVLADLELPIEEKHAQVVMHPLPRVTANRSQLQQVFQNLLSNALKYSKPDVPPVITVNAQVVKGGDMPDLPAGVADRSYHLIEVRDNGIGFEPEYAAQIFEMFRRLHGKSEYSGTGVGLAIVRKVLQNHDGYVWAESAPGEGSVFRILLPADAE